MDRQYSEEALGQSPDWFTICGPAFSRSNQCTDFIGLAKTSPQFSYLLTYSPWFSLRAHHFLSCLHSVWAEEERGEGGGGEGSHGAGLRGLTDASKEGHPKGLWWRRRGGRGEHPWHRPQVSAWTSTGHVQEVKKKQIKRTLNSGSSLAWLGCGAKGGEGSLCQGQWVEWPLKVWGWEEKWGESNWSGCRSGSCRSLWGLGKGFLPNC